MGVLTHEFSSSVAPERLFKALVLDGDNLIPQLAPNAVKSVEILEGDGGVGTTKKVTYFKGSAVQKTEAIDKDKLEIVYSVIEGDVLTDKIEKITYENKFVAAPGGGTVIKNVTTYHNRPGNSGVALDQDQVEESKATGSQIFQLLEKYLLENPRAYN